MTSPLCVLVGNVASVEFVFVVSAALSSHEALGTLRVCVSHRAAGTSRNCVYCVQPAEAARVGAGLRLITLRLQDYGNNRLPAAGCWVPSQPAGWAGCGRLSPCCRGRFFTQSHDGRHLDSHCSWTKNSSAVLSPNTTKMTERR